MFLGSILCAAFEENYSPKIVWSSLEPTPQQIWSVVWLRKQEQWSIRIRWKSKYHNPQISVDRKIPSFLINRWTLSCQLKLFFTFSFDCYKKTSIVFCLLGFCRIARYLWSVPSRGDFRDFSLGFIVGAPKTPRICQGTKFMNLVNEMSVKVCSKAVRLLMSARDRTRVSGEIERNVCLVLTWANM